MIFVTHGVNVQSFINYAVEKGPDPRVKLTKFVGYCGVAAAAVKGKSFRIVLGGNTPQLKNNAAENHLQKRLASDHFAIRAIEHLLLDKQFKFVSDSLNKDKNKLQSLSLEVKLELYAL